MYCNSERILVCPVASLPISKSLQTFKKGFTVYFCISHCKTKPVWFQLSQSHHYAPQNKWGQNKKLARPTAKAELDLFQLNSYQYPPCIY